MDMAQFQPAQLLSSTDLDKQFNSFLDAWLVDPPGLAEQPPGMGAQLPDSADPFAGLSAYTTFDYPPSAPGPPATENSNAYQTFSFTGVPMHSQPDVELLLEAASSGKGSRNSDDSFPGTADADKLNRKSKILEKNRRAQKKFREKQKSKMVELESQVNMLTSSLQSVSVAKTCLERQNEVLQKVLELRQNQIDVLTEQARISESLEDTAEYFRQVKEASGKLRDGLTVEQCRSLTGKDAILRWKQYVDKLATCLIETEMLEPPASAVATLAEVAQAAGTFAETLAVMNPKAIKTLIVSNLENGTWDEARRNDPQFWSSIVDAVMLDDEQKHKILCLAQILTRSIARLGDERARLGEELQEHLPGTYGAHRHLGSCIKVQDTMDALRRNFQAEHGAWTSFSATVLGKILTGLQFARFCTRSYPMFPNAFQMAKCVALSGFVSGPEPADVAALLQLKCGPATAEATLSKLA